MKKFTPAIKKRITEDWQNLLPQFKQYQTMALARRVGPLVHGICLDRDSSNAAYLPTVHIHCLCRPFPAVALNLRQPLLSKRSGTIDPISIQFHEKNYRDACERLIASSLLPVTGDWKMSQVLAAFHKYRHLELSDSRYPVTLMEVAVSLWAWLEKPEEAEDLARKYLEEAKDWPENVLTTNGGLVGWGETIKGLASSGEKLKQVADEEVANLNLQQLPQSQLLA